MSVYRKAKWWWQFRFLIVPRLLHYALVGGLFFSLGFGACVFLLADAFQRALDAYVVCTPRPGAPMWSQR
ncbi:hypothetical protein GCM10007907_24880 [Chitinimonas prasina]|uniref:PepSY domain-containing protein n=1 Tax=Chitinimonas prasina TaxID=1434937 RepID=A0ABQ5YI84_9NEIS|nr:hypothetical protein [Chitinimonas prasina]GLR13698.1 hypothetical protein GCM10007907_24880 [Chitinimonas prasina]